MLADQRTLPYLLNALKSQDHEIRLAAIKVLGENPNKEMIAALLPELNDDHVLNKIAAVHALGNCHDKAVIGPMMLLFDVDYPDLSKEIVLSLTALTGMNLGDDSNSWISWWKQKTN